jgi:hypothetical protein
MPRGFVQGYQAGSFVKDLQLLGLVALYRGTRQAAFEGHVAVRPLGSDQGYQAGSFVNDL